MQSSPQNHLTAHERLLEQLRERRRLLGQNSLDRQLVRSGQKEFSNQRPSASNLLATPKKRPLGSSGITLSGRHSSLGLLDTPTKRTSNADGSELRQAGFELGSPTKRQGRVYSTIHSLHHAHRLMQPPSLIQTSTPSFSSGSSSASRPSSRPVSRHGGGSSAASRRKVKREDDILYRWIN